MLVLAPLFYMKACGYISLLMKFLVCKVNYGEPFRFSPALMWHPHFCNYGRVSLLRLVHLASCSDRALSPHIVSSAFAFCAQASVTKSHISTILCFSASISGLNPSPFLLWKEFSKRHCFQVSRASKAYFLTSTRHSLEGRGEMGNRECFYANSISMCGHYPQGCLCLLSPEHCISIIPSQSRISQHTLLRSFIEWLELQTKTESLYPDVVSNIVKEKSLLGQEKTEDVGLL